MKEKIVTMNCNNCSVNIALTGRNYRQRLQKRMNRKQGNKIQDREICKKNKPT